MEPFGTTMAAQSGILEPVGSPFDQMLIWFNFLFILKVMLEHFGVNFNTF